MDSESSCPNQALLPFALTAFKNSKGPLSKRLYLDDDGRLQKTSTAELVAGRAKRLTFSSIADFAAALAAMDSSEAIALGVLADGLPDKVDVTTVPRLKAQANPPANLIARSQEFLRYRPGAPALILLDHDTGQMPEAVRDRIAAAGGFWPALCQACPELAQAARVTRASTSAGLYHQETGAALPGSDGQHVYIVAIDGSDAKRFLASLQERAWLAGFGWFAVSSTGALLVRSIIDSAVYGPERLIFEGAPTIQPPLAQAQAARQPVAVDGGMVDTATICPDLQAEERQHLRTLQAEEETRLAEVVAAKREAYAARIAARDHVTLERAREIVAAQMRGVLPHDSVLTFLDGSSITVGALLADPNRERFIGKAVCHPGTTPQDDQTRAQIRLHRKDGSLFVHSFNHGGGTVFTLEAAPAPEQPEQPEEESTALWIDADEWDEAAIPTRPWVAPGYALRGAVTMLGGPPGVMKSLLSLTWATAVALGKQHGRFKPEQAAPVIVYNVEDDKAEQQRRLSAILQQFDASPRDLKGKLFRCGPSSVGTLIARDSESNTLIATPAMTRLVELVKQIKPAVVFLDPFSELHVEEENDNGAIRNIIAQFRKIAVQYSCAVVILHHTRKGSTNEPGNVDTLRGASAIIGACRIVLTLSTMTDKDAEQFKIIPNTPKQRNRYARLDDGKANYAALDDAQWYVKQLITLQNGEGVVSPVPWAPPEQEESEAVIEAIAEAIKQGVMIEGVLEAWSPKLDTNARSIRTLLTKHGFTSKTQEDSVLKKLEDEYGVESSDYNSRRARHGVKGYRIGDAPAVAWEHPHATIGF